MGKPLAKWNALPRDLPRCLHSSRVPATVRARGDGPSRRVLRRQENPATAQPPALVPCAQGLSFNVYAPGTGLPYRTGTCQTASRKYCIGSAIRCPCASRLRAHDSVRGTASAVVARQSRMFRVSVAPSHGPKPIKKGERLPAPLAIRRRVALRCDCPLYGASAPNAP